MNWPKLAELAPEDIATIGGAFGPIGGVAAGAYAAPKGERLRGAGVSGIGAIGGGLLSGVTLMPLLGMGGAAAGGAIGGLADGRQGAITGAQIGSILGHLTGAAAGTSLGARLGYEIGMPKKAALLPRAVRQMVKQAYAEAVPMAIAQLPYMAPTPIRQEQAARGLNPAAVAALGLGLTGMHLAGDAPTIGNSIRRTVNSTLGTDLDTESRAHAVLKALR